MDDRIPTEGPPRPGLTEQRTHERPRGWGALLISFGLALLLMIPQAILLQCRLGAHLGQLHRALVAQTFPLFQHRRR